MRTHRHKVWWLYRLRNLITAIHSVLNWATGYMLKVKYSDFVAGFMENMDLVLHLAQRPDWLRHSHSHPIGLCKGHFAGAKALGVWCQPLIYRRGQEWWNESFTPHTSLWRDVYQTRLTIMHFTSNHADFNSQVQGRRFLQKVGIMYVKTIIWLYRLYRVALLLFIFCTVAFRGSSYW
jgi:hypothetical protein